jgi:hypothetical protein
VSVMNAALDDEVAQEVVAAAYQANKLTCNVCGYVASEAKSLGTHKRSKHGIAGTSKSATVRQRYVAERKRRRQARSGTIIDTVLAYLEANRGPHHYDDICEALDLDLSQVKNALSKAKINGQPIGSDGNGNWRWTEGLEVRASSRPPRTTVSRELVPVLTTNGHKPPRVFRPVELGDDLELLETEAEDGGTSLWLATRIK